MTPRIYLDTNVFIYAYETRGARSDDAWRILEAIERKELIAVTSELTLAEVLVGAITEGDDELAGHYHSILSSDADFLVSAVERPVLIEAAALRALSRSLKLPDAIHVATARLQDCSFVVSGDSRISDAPGLTIVPLGPNSLDIIRGESR